MREKTSSLLFKGEFSKECKIVRLSSMTYFREAKASKSDSVQEFKEFRISQAAGRKFEAILLSDKVTFMINDI